MNVPLRKLAFALPWNAKAFHLANATFGLLTFTFTISVRAVYRGDFYLFCSDRIDGAVTQLHYIFSKGHLTLEILYIDHVQGFLSQTKIKYKLLYLLPISYHLCI